MADVVGAPVAAAPSAAVVPAVAAGTDALSAVVVEAALPDWPLGDEPAEVAGAAVLALDPVAAVEAIASVVVVAVEPG